MSRRRFGLVGKDIGHSFSAAYFTERFAKDGAVDCSYENFDLPDIVLFPAFIKESPDLAGLNVTIPYKEQIIPFLDSLSRKAMQIGAVNVIRFTKKGKLKGYNSDYYGFEQSLQPLLQPHHKKALILGTGGASKAVAFALQQMGILYAFVSRVPSANTVAYEHLNATTFDNYQIVINCTPLGTSPNVDDFPPIPYQFFTDKHIAFDLIYNPELTLFLKKAKENRATTQNGMDMLVYQAEKAWKIWNK
jgi:shikimate dehydrogenase